MTRYTLGVWEPGSNYSNIFISQDAKAPIQEIFG
jgi:hypothetical protein